MSKRVRCACVNFYSIFCFCFFFVALGHKCCSFRKSHLLFDTSYAAYGWSYVCIVCSPLSARFNLLLPNCNYTVFARAFAPIFIWIYFHSFSLPLVALSISRDVWLFVCASSTKARNIGSKASKKVGYMEPGDVVILEFNFIWSALTISGFENGW